MNIPINLSQNIQAVADDVQQMVTGELQHLAAQGQHFADDFNNAATGLAALMQGGEQ